MQLRKRLTVGFVLLMMAAVMTEQLNASPMQGPQMHFRPRYPRRDNYAAYNIHKTFKARDVNELDASQARKAMVDVQQTIAEVQRLLAKDPTLPRLTRGEIEELFENVTREELAKSLREGDQNRAQHMRALMLVLPYNTNNMSPENIQNMYTLPPVTKVVQNEVVPRKQTLPKIIPTKMTATTARTTQRKRKPATETTEAASTTAVPITTIRFTTPKPTTFHPALPNVIRDEAKPAQTKPAIVSTTPITEVPVTVMEYVTKPIEPVTENAPVKFEIPISTTEDAVKNSEISKILASLGFGDGVPPTFRPLPVEMTTPAGIADIIAELTTPTTESPSKEDEELRMLLRSFGLLNDNRNSVGLNPLGDPLALIPETLTEVQPSHLIQSEDLKVEELEPAAPAMAKPDIKPDDYVAFKPLPSDAPKLDEGLDALLKSFGIIDNGDRQEKSLKAESSTISSVSNAATTEMEEMPMIDKDLVVPQMASLLDNLGIQTMKKDRNGRKLTSSKDFEGTEMKSNGVAFRPKKKSEKPEKFVNEDYRKLEQLWETIRELEKLNPNLTEESLESLNLKNFNLSESLLSQGPNPLESYDINRINDIKKRQQPTTEDTPTRISLDLALAANSSTSNTSSNQVEIISTTSGDQPRSTILEIDSSADAPSSSTTTTTTTTETSSTTSSDNSARFTALEESFGGGADPVEQEPLPPPRRNGFYFLADWNSFLEVGEDPNKVVISFRPQAGDPSRFLPVNVP
ncbi:AAEL008831-PA [Aedes aegypti]|nr:AAEL008831-PA [Aedes aegypti]